MAARFAFSQRLSTKTVISPLESRQGLFMPLKELELGIVDRSGEHICSDAVLHHTDGLALEAVGCAIRAFRQHPHATVGEDR